MTVINFQTLNVVFYLSILIFVFIFGIICIRKTIWNFIDPILLVIFNVSFNVANVLYFTIQSNSKLGFLLFIILSYLSFLFGLRINTQQYVVKKRNDKKKFGGLSKFSTIYLIIISIIFQSAYYIFVFSKTGFGLFTGMLDPSTVKVTLTMAGGGIGILKYISWGGRLLFLPLIVHAYHIHKLKIITFISVAWFILINILFPFSKAGLFFMIFDFGIIYYYYKEAGYPIQISKKIIIFLLIIALIPASIVLKKASIARGAPIVHILLERFIDTGGGSYQYFVLDGYKAFQDTEYFQKLIYYFDTLPSVFRLKKWEPMSYMAYMTGYLRGCYTPGFGANPFMFMDGHFLLGYGGVLYCFFLGLFISFIRSRRKINIIVFYILLKLVIPLIGDPAISHALIVSIILLSPFFLFLYLLNGIYNKKLSIEIRPHQNVKGKLV